MKVLLGISYKEKVAIRCDLGILWILIYIDDKVGAHYSSLSLVSAVECAGPSTPLERGTAHNCYTSSLYRSTLYHTQLTSYLTHPITDTEVGVVASVDSRYCM